MTTRAFRLNQMARRDRKGFEMKRIFAILVALGLAGTAQAHGTSAGALEIIHPNIPAPAPNAVTAAGYMAISNGGDHADRPVASHENLR